MPRMISQTDRWAETEAKNISYRPMTIILLKSNGNCGKVGGEDEYLRRSRQRGRGEGEQSEASSYSRYLPAPQYLTSLIFELLDILVSLIFERPDICPL